MENPYNDVNDLSPWKWMLKNHKKKMIFSFLFISIFMVVPWIGRYRIEETWLALLISGGALVINFLATFLQPYLIYRSKLRNWQRWEDNKKSGMFD